MRVAGTLVACVLTLCIVNLDVPVVPQSPSGTSTPEALEPTADAPSAPSSQAEPECEAAALRAQLELMRQYDERLLQTVYWALGTAFGLVVFAAGAGWYVNFRLYERDKQALRTELRSEVETRSESIRRSLEEDAEQVRTSLHDASDKMSADLHVQADQRSKQIEKTALESVQAAADSLRTELKAVRMDILEIAYKMSISDAENWRQQGVHMNELRDYMESLSLAMQLTRSRSSAEWRLQEPLKGIHGALQADARPGVEEVASLIEMLDSLPNKYSMQATKIRALLAKDAD
jgi:hypothetical protein